MHYDALYKSISGMLCNGSYLCDWNDGVPIYDTMEKVQKHIEDLENRIEQKNYTDKEERRLMKTSLRAAEKLQKCLESSVSCTEFEIPRLITDSKKDLFW